MKNEDYKKKLLTVADETLTDLHPVTKKFGEKIGEFCKEEILKIIDVLFTKIKSTIKSKIGSKEGNK